MEPEAEDISKVNLLIIDDDPKKSKVLETTLFDPRYEFTIARSGREALKHLIDKDFALILLDINMPGMDGFETASLIRGRDRTKETPIIFITAFISDEISVTRGYSLGAVDFISTPFDPFILRAKVSILVELYTKTEKVRRQAEIIRAADRMEHERELYLTKQQLELDALKIKEEATRREMEQAEKNARELHLKARELERSNAELAQFAYVVSHDLQEPLRTISSYSRLLEERIGVDLDVESAQYFHFIIDAAKRLQQMIVSLLEYSRIGFDKAPADLIDCSTIIKETLDDLRQSIRETDAVINFESLPKVQANRIQLGQLFQNMISNAIRFRGKDPPKITITAKEKDGYHVFSVKDNGIGIESNYYEKIFVVFQRLHTREKYHGSGIGLSLCKKIVERHDGKIWVESEPGKGSEFFFSLPIKNQ